MKLLAPLLLCISLLAGCVEQSQLTPPPVQTVTPAQVVALELCPQGYVCEEGGRAAVRVTSDSYDSDPPRVQVVIQQSAEWGVAGPPIRFDNTRRNDHPRGYNRGRYNSGEWRNYESNQRRRAEIRFGIRNNCHTYRKPNGEPACL